MVPRYFAPRKLLVFLVASASLASHVVAGYKHTHLDLPMHSGISGVPPNSTVWTEATQLGIQGRGWSSDESDSPYARFPSRAKSLLCSSEPCKSNCSVPTCEADRCAVWGLSQTATGLYVRFQTTAPTVHVQFRMVPENGDWLWALNGHSGVDVYVQDANTAGRWRWATSSGNNPGSTGGAMHQYKLDHNGEATFTASLGEMATTSTPRNFTLYFPSRGFTKSIQIGVAPTEMPPIALPAAVGKPVVMYGTSILHSAGSGRAGMTYSSQMERYIQKPVLNLGMSGHGLMQQEVGSLLSELDASVFVLDCEYNMDKYNQSDVACLTYQFIKQLRAAKPKAKVLLIEGHDGTKNWMNHAGQLKENRTRNGYRTAFNKLFEEGDSSVSYLDGSGKLGGPIATDFEAQVGAVGGVHVSNLAFTHFSRYVGDAVTRVLNGAAPVLQKLLEEIPIPQPPVLPVTKWVEATALGLEGQAWRGHDALLANRYDRFPAAAKLDRNITEITWELSECTPSMVVRFATNATNLQVRVKRRSIGSGLLNLTATQDDIMSYNGRFGIDIYAGDEGNGGAWRWFETSAGGSQQEQETLTITSLSPMVDGSDRKYTVHFPTHIALDTLQIGVPDTARLEPYAPYAGHRPILVWASSIGQGGVVQNAGLPWISQVGRSLDREVYNFGFSGDCLMQPDVAKYLLSTPVKPSVFVVDCLPNMNAALVTERAEPLFRQLRAGLGPEVPILVLEGHTYSNSWVLPAIYSGQQSKRLAQREAFNKASDTDRHIHYVYGDGKLASLGESQYDATSGIGVHPTSIAHYRIGKFVASKIRALPDWEK